MLRCFEIGEEITMRKFSSWASATAVVVAASVAVGGCSQVGRLKGKMAFKDANVLYQGQDYRQAASKYEETLADCRGSGPDCTDPDLDSAYFFLGNSYDNMYRPSRRGEAANDELLTKAIANYKKASEIENDPKIKRLAFDYLVNSYGPDKLNDPAQAEPILLNMIQMDPKESTSYFGLANIYEQSGDYERSEQMLQKAREMRPTDPAVYMQLAGFYNRQGEFTKTMEALNDRAKQEPTNPEAHYTIATYYWEKAYRDFTTPEPDKLRFVQQGLNAVDEAIKLKPDYFEALTYKNLLLRVQANLEKNPGRQQALLREADQFRNRAQDIQKKQRAGGA
jgi:tetratricopeptide (TPR) repeat protein